MNDPADPRGHAPGSDDFFGSGPMAGQARAFDWSRTPLGPVAQWPTALRTMVRTAFASSFPQLVLWGPHLTQIYNDAFQPILDAKHPRALGQAAAECWTEIWSTLAPMLERVLHHGEPVGAQDRRFVVHRNDCPEETYFTFSYSAIVDEAGTVRGVLVTCFETTATVLQGQRLRAISELATVVARVRTLADAASALEQVYSRHQHLFAFELIYLLDGHNGCARRWLCSGLAEHSSLAPAEILLDADGGEKCAWPVAEAIRSRAAVKVNDVGTRFGPVPGPNRGDPVRSAVIVPLFTPGHKEPSGVAIFGANPHRPLDDAYAGFFEWTGAKVSLALANAQAHELDRRRTEELEARVAARTAELEDANSALLAKMGERRLMESNLRRQSQRLATLSSDLINAHERERRDIARELHDEIGQSLTLLKLGVRTARHAPVERMAAALADTEAGIAHLLERVRNLCLDVRPALLDDLGLLPALVALVERFHSRNNLECRFQHHGIDTRRFPATVETTAYRVVQEALTNVLRHAAVTSVNLKVWADADQMQLRVEDAGRGFELAGAMRSPLSSGLPGMRERVQLAGGELSILTAPNKGTQVIAELPLRYPIAFSECADSRASA